MKHKNLLIGLGAVAFVAILIYLSMGQKVHRVEVCMTFSGRSNCRIAAGPTREQALRAATDNACAIIASGMTDSMSCGQMQPTSIKWLE